MDQVIQAGRGFVLGKFMPPHRGHQLLIDFARGFCDDVTVLVCSLSSDPIPGDVRFNWMREMFPQLNVQHLSDDMPQEPCDHPEFWAIWRNAIRRIEPRPINFVFASEPYGLRLAMELDARFIPVDPRRELRPWTATAIRKDPMGAWEALPECVRPWFVKRICIVGPESTGKSTLARNLAAHFHTVYAWEHARPLLDLKDGRCDAEDIPLIARSQIAIEDAMARQANRLLFCDTTLLLTHVWSTVLFGSCPHWIVEEARARKYALTLLLDTDVPWVDDAQRYFPEQQDRVRFFETCRAALEEAGHPYVVLSGSHHDRLQSAILASERLLGDDVLPQRA